MDEAARALRTAVAEPAAEPLDAFHGLRLDNDFDSTRTGATASVGLYWSDVLYFELFNRSQFEAHLHRAEPGQAGPPAPDGLSFRARPARAMPANPRASIELDLSLIYIQTMPAACSGRHVAHR